MNEKDAIAKVLAWRREATDDPEAFWGRAAEQVPVQRPHGRARVQRRHER